MMPIRTMPGPQEYSRLDTESLRQAFLVESLFQPGVINLSYVDADRAVLGSALPGHTELTLAADPGLKASYFCERRELGILNIGGPGVVRIDGRSFELERLDCVYAGRGSREVIFASADASSPAVFYLLSYPAHATYATTLARLKDASRVELGTSADANRRTIYKHIHSDGVKSCQLVMGFTRLAEGSVWNTMPPHTHARRSEVYLYFDLGPSRRVMHLMGTPGQTRHLVVSDRQAVLSPSWSIHCGCGTGAYSFCWGMGGENQAFDDMDAAPLEQLK